MSEILMARIKYIKSAAEIPAQEKYVLVQYGAGAKEIRHSRGLIVIVSESGSGTGEFQQAVERAERLADKEGIFTVFVIDRRRQDRQTIT
jgi:hypothetical protein